MFMKAQIKEMVDYTNEEKIEKLSRMLGEGVVIVHVKDTHKWNLMYKGNPCVLEPVKHGIHITWIAEDGSLRDEFRETFLGTIDVLDKVV